MEIIPHRESTPSMAEEKVVERITSLEEKHAHQERIISDLNEVILEQQKRITRLESLLQRADERIEQIHAALDQPRSADQERPPHY